MYPNAVDALRGSIHPFDSRIHDARPYPGQVAAAENIRTFIEGSAINTSHEHCGKVQDAYSLRCSAQVHGAARDALAFVRHTLTTEANAATDNPTRTVGNVRNIFAKHGGNMGSTGSVGFLFKKMGVFRLKPDGIDSDDLDVTATDILVLKNVGPLTPAGMPEAGYLPIPKKLARQGVKDMVRMSDCRMSGTAFGTIVLHIAPEAAAGGPLDPCGAWAGRPGPPRCWSGPSWR